MELFLFIYFIIRIYFLIFFIRNIDFSFTYSTKSFLASIGFAKKNTCIIFIIPNLKVWTRGAFYQRLFITSFRNDHLILKHLQLIICQKRLNRSIKHSFSTHKTLNRYQFFRLIKYWFKIFQRTISTDSVHIWTFNP